MLFLQPLSPGGGNGRRAWLRAMSPLGGASSILVLGTITVLSVSLETGVFTFLTYPQYLESQNSRLTL